MNILALSQSLSSCVCVTDVGHREVKGYLSDV